MPRQKKLSHRDMLNRCVAYPDLKPQVRAEFARLQAILKRGGELTERDKEWIRKTDETIKDARAAARP